MDFEGLFWIALIVFYFMSRVLGGKKRSKPSPRPTGGPRPERSRTSSSTGEPELDEALREIRRALGFPVDEPEAEPPSQPEPEPASELEKQRELRTAEMERRREQDAREVTQRRVQDAREMARKRDRTAREASRERDAREVTRQQEMLERAREADEKRAPAIPKPEVARRPGPIGAHPMESSFGEEEMFEGTGRHPHEVAPADYALQAPYTSKPEQHARLQRRLHGKASLREAFVLKEVLDKPLSLRGRR